MATKVKASKSPIGKVVEAITSKKKSKEESGERSSIRKLGGTYFYSAGITQKKNVFVTPEYMDLLVNAFKLAELQQDIKNLAYVVMPNHFYWIFRLSNKQDDPVQVYAEVKKTVAWEIIKQLREESKGDSFQRPLFDIFEENEKVKRSNPRKVLWTFKEEAKKLEGKGKYRVWDTKSRLKLLEDDESIVKSAAIVTSAPTRERWQLVSKTKEYPYLYAAQELVDKLAA